MPKPEASKRILLVEDDDADAELSILALRDYNLLNTIDRVSDGVEALDYLRCTGEYKNREPGHPVVVILDLKMPKMSGIEVLREIRNDSALKYQPVVVLTSSKEERDIIDSYRLGVNGYAVKPVEFDQFAAAVKELGIFWLAVNQPPPDKLYESIHVEASTVSE